MPVCQNITQLINNYIQLFLPTNLDQIRKLTEKTLFFINTDLPTIISYHVKQLTLQAIDLEFRNTIFA